jgi:predicted methyltransferase
MIVLSHVTVTPLKTARIEGATAARVSLDLSLSETAVTLDDEGAHLPDGQTLPWPAIDEIAATDNACFLVEDGQATKIQFYSEALHRFYSLYPTKRAPTMMLSGIPMHRIKTVDPWQDTELKMRAMGGVSGNVLDICTGLGYTAIAASRLATKVTTIELDPTVLEVCRRNPWSRELFDNPKIEQVIGNGADVVEGFTNESFSRIFHDPPTFKLAGELYSGEFYGQLFRILKRGGRLFHYIGDLDSTTGRVVAKGVVKRLQDAGFHRVTRRPEAFGIAASK